MSYFLRTSLTALFQNNGSETGIIIFYDIDGNYNSNLIKRMNKYDCKLINRKNSHVSLWKRKLKEYQNTEQKLVQLIVKTLVQCNISLHQDKSFFYFVYLLYSVAKVSSRYLTQNKSKQVWPNVCGDFLDNCGMNNRQASTN